MRFILALVKTVRKILLVIIAMEIMAIVGAGASFLLGQMQQRQWDEGISRWKITKRKNQGRGILAKQRQVKVIPSSTVRDEEINPSLIVKGSMTYHVCLNTGSDRAKEPT